MSSAAEKEKSPQDSLVGQMIGSYRLLDKLGEGGMGAVYVGMHVGLLHEYAIKVLPKKQTESKEALKRFMREAQRAGELDHPNIVPVIHFGLEESKYYMVMVRVDGKSLKQVLRRYARAKKPIPLVDAVCWVRQAAAGLEYAHNEGIIHRDIKPDNLLLGRDGLLRIADFGLARRVENEDLTITQTQQILGTPMYMPLEQWSAEQVDHRADIYALGATMYHLLCGEPPVVGKSAIEILRRRMDNKFDKPRKRRSGISPTLEAAMLAMIERDPENRPRNMTSVLKMLDEACPEARAAAQKALEGLAGEEAESSASGESHRAAAAARAGTDEKAKPDAAMPRSAKPVTIEVEPERVGTMELSLAEAVESQPLSPPAKQRSEREAVAADGQARQTEPGKGPRTSRRRLYRRFAATMTASWLVIVGCLALWWTAPPPGWDMRPYVLPLQEERDERKPATPVDDEPTEQPE